jgi:hypothetical protein
MKKHFYHEIVEIDSIHFALNGLELTREEKAELVQLVEESIHHAVMDSLLSELSEKDKKVFLALIIAQDHTEIWQLLDDNIENPREKVKTIAFELRKKMHDDIEEAHTKKTS